MAPIMSCQRTLCAVVALAAGANAIQNNPLKATFDAGAMRVAQEWNPFDVLAPHTDSSKVPEDVKKAGKHAKKNVKKAGEHAKDDVKKATVQAKEDVEEASANAKEHVEKAAVHAKIDLEKVAADAQAMDADLVLRPWVPPACSAELCRTKPRMLVSAGCDATPAIIQHSQMILAMHGIGTSGKNLRTLHDDVEKVLDNTDSRVLVEKADKHDLGCGDSCRAMVQTQKYFATKNRSVVFKGLIGADRDAMLSKTVKDMGTLIAMTSRRNKLDQVVCMVRDCALKNEGTNEQHGKPSDLCWKRRVEDAEGYKAMLQTDRLVDAMKNIEEKEERTKHELKSQGYDVGSFQSEDLLDFEWNTEAKGAAMSAWTSLLKSWGVHPEKKEIIKYIEKNAGTRDAPVSQLETVVNFGEVKALLETRTKYAWMIRE